MPAGHIGQLFRIRIALAVRVLTGHRICRTSAVVGVSLGFSDAHILLRSHGLGPLMVTKNTLPQPTA